MSELCPGAMTAPDKLALKAATEACPDCNKRYMRNYLDHKGCDRIRHRSACAELTIARLRTENARLLAELEAARGELQKRGVCPHVFCSACALAALAGYDFVSGATEGDKR